MGAMTALQFASAFPDRLRTLVVVGITTQREPRASVARRLMDPRRADVDDPDWGVVLARRHDAGQGVGAWRTLLPAIAADVAVQPLLTPARAPRDRRPPPLIACGDRDPFVPVGHAWELQRQLPDARLFVVPDCGHEVMVAPARALQRGTRRLLPLDAAGRGSTGRRRTRPYRLTHDRRTR